MTWQRDGSGLDVKRVRGRTVPQWEHLLNLADRGLSARYARRHMFGRCSDVDTMRLFVRLCRKRRRDRRAKRLAKAAARRLDTLPRLRWRKGERVLAIPPETLRAHLRPLWREQCVERFRPSVLGVGKPTAPTFEPPSTWDTAIIRTTRPDGTVQEFRIGALEASSESAALFEDTCADAAQAVSRAIVGDLPDGRDVTFQPIDTHVDCASSSATIAFFEPGLCAFCGKPLDTQEVGHALGS